MQLAFLELLPLPSDPSTQLDVHLHYLSGGGEQTLQRGDSGVARQFPMLTKIEWQVSDKVNRIKTFINKTSSCSGRLNVSATRKSAKQIYDTQKGRSLAVRLARAPGCSSQ
jgi:hypothetical protein